MISAALVSNFGIVPRHVTIQSVRLYFGLNQDPLHRRLADTQILGQLAARPVGAAIGGLLLCSAESPAPARRVSLDAACFPDVFLANPPCLPARSGSSTSTPWGHSRLACVRSRDNSFRPPAPVSAAREIHPQPAMFATAPSSPVRLVVQR